jgi:hypothetical protein
MRKAKSYDKSNISIPKAIEIEKREEKQRQYIKKKSIRDSKKRYEETHKEQYRKWKHDWYLKNKEKKHSKKG